MATGIGYMKFTPLNVILCQNYFYYYDFLNLLRYC